MDSQVYGQSVILISNLTTSDESELLAFLRKNKDVFTWFSSDLKGVSREVIEHKLTVSDGARPKKKKLRKMSNEKIIASRPKCTDCWTQT